MVALSVPLMTWLLQVHSVFSFSSFLDNSSTLEFDYLPAYNILSSFNDQPDFSPVNSLLQKYYNDAPSGSTTHKFVTYKRRRRNAPSGGSPVWEPECSHGCCGRTHVCGLRGCAFKARCGIDCCPPQIVQNVRMRAQPLTPAVVGVPPGALLHQGPGDEFPDNGQHQGRPPSRPPQLRSFMGGSSSQAPPPTRDMIENFNENNRINDGGFQGPPPPIPKIGPPAKPLVDPNMPLPTERFSDRNRLPPPPPPPPPPIIDPPQSPHPMVDHPHRPGGIMQPADSIGPGGAPELGGGPHGGQPNRLGPPHEGAGEGFPGPHGGLPGSQGIVATGGRPGPHGGPPSHNSGPHGGKVGPSGPNSIGLQGGPSNRNGQPHLSGGPPNGSPGGGSHGGGNPIHNGPHVGPNHGGSLDIGPHGGIHNGPHGGHGVSPVGGPAPGNAHGGPPTDLSWSPGAPSLNHLNGNNQQNGHPLSPSEVIQHGSATRFAPIVGGPSRNGQIQKKTNAFGPSSRGGFGAAVKERRTIESTSNGSQPSPPGRLTFSSKPAGQRPPPGKSPGPRRAAAFTTRPPGSVDKPVIRPPAFGLLASEKEMLPFLPSPSKRCCECCMPDCHHGCIRNGGCAICDKLTGGNRNGISRGLRTKKNN